MVKGSVKLKHHRLSNANTNLTYTCSKLSVLCQCVELCVRCYVYNDKVYTCIYRKQVSVAMSLSFNSILIRLIYLIYGIH